MINSFSSGNNGNSCGEEKLDTSLQSSSSSSSHDLSQNIFNLPWNDNSDIALYLINSDSVYKDNLVNLFGECLWVKYNYSEEMINFFNSSELYDRYKDSLDFSESFKYDFCVMNEHALYDGVKRYIIAQSLVFPKYYTEIRYKMFIKFIQSSSDFQKFPDLVNLIASLENTCANMSSYNLSTISSSSLMPATYDFLKKLGSAVILKDIEYAQEVAKAIYKIVFNTESQNALPAKIDDANFPKLSTIYNLIMEIKPDNFDEIAIQVSAIALDEKESKLLSAYIVNYGKQLLKNVRNDGLFAYEIEENSDLNYSGCRSDWVLPAIQADYASISCTLSVHEVNRILYYLNDELQRGFRVPGYQSLQHKLVNLGVSASPGSYVSEQKGGSVSSGSMEPNSKFKLAVSSEEYAVVKKALPEFKDDSDSISCLISVNRVSTVLDFIEEKFPEGVQLPAAYESLYKKLILLDVSASPGSDVSEQKAASVTSNPTESNCKFKLTIFREELDIIKEALNRNSVASERAVEPSEEKSTALSVVDNIAWGAGVTGRVLWHNGCDALKVLDPNFLARSVASITPAAQLFHPAATSLLGNVGSVLRVGSRLASDGVTPQVVIELAGQYLGSREEGKSNSGSGPSV